MYITRTIEPLIKKWLFKGRAIIVYGPRQVGKTTMLKKIVADIKIPYSYLNCDEIDIQNKFREAQSSTKLNQILGRENLVVIDEAQRIKDIGIKLKLIIDTFPSRQLIVTGSSSLDLASKILEPLTGRNVSFWLYPFSLRELATFWDRLEIERNLDSVLNYGSYPAVILATSNEEKELRVKELARDYLYRDALEFAGHKNSETLAKLLMAFALQIGGEVAYSELSNLLGINRPIVQHYTEILTESYVVFKTLPFSRNLRKELGKRRKIYFLDNGMRNAILGQFNLVEHRTDIGALWENFVVSEVKKRQFDILNSHNLYFWRTYDQQEIDLVEDFDGKLHATEIKWQKLKKRPPKAWRENYPGSSFRGISKDNFLDYLL